MVVIYCDLKTGSGKALKSHEISTFDLKETPSSFERRTSISVAP